MYVIVQTTPETTPLAVLKEELDSLITEVTSLMRNLQDKITSHDFSG